MTDAPQTDTTLTDFARLFEPAFAPLLQPLQACAEALAQTRSTEVESEIVPVLRDTAHHAGMLLEKVREQHAYVLVFGPLKSGKSTLLNALAATYVSEVTALPAYPCMVFVSHAPTTSFEVTRYDGSRETLHDTEGLKGFVEDAHRDLAEKLVAAESEGRDFEPGRDFPQALRRIDVKLPAEELNETRAVLVDTPGLYSRMKFGYDAMTRDFQNTAACAVFVVKTDNLFLEQVFEEFERLLALFSRVYLVVNVDRGKQDLGPAGDLAPSAEAHDPAKIIQAFRTFSMGPAMRAAYDEGRLRLYTVDLLSAARHRLRGLEEDEASPSGLIDLNSDLSSFLQSSDYLVAFRKDCRQQGQYLLDRTEEALNHRAIEAIEQKLDEDRGLLQLAQEREAALERVAANDWEAAGEEMSKKVRSSVEDALSAAATTANDELDSSLDDWFGGSGSLADLTDAWTKDLKGHLKSCDQRVRAAIAQVATSPQERLTDGLSKDLRLLDINLASLSSAPPTDATARVKVGRIKVDVEALPVQRGFLDWILFRTNAKLRKRLFGSAEDPRKAIDAATKEKRLGDACRDALNDALDRGTTQLLPKQRENVLTALLDAQRAERLSAIQKAIEERRQELTAQLRELQARVDYGEGIIGPARNLAAEAERAREALAALEDRFFPTDEVELEPAPRPGSQADAVASEAPATEEPVEAVEDEELA